MTNETAHQDVNNQDSTQGIRVSAWKAFGVVATSVLVTFVGTVFTVGSILNADHFTVLSHTGQINALKEEQLTKELYEADQRAVKLQLETLTKGINDLTTSHNELRNDIRDLNRNGISYSGTKTMGPSPSPIANRTDSQPQNQNTIVYAQQPQGSNQPSSQPQSNNQEPQPNPSPLSGIITLVQSIFPI